MCLVGHSYYSSVAAVRVGASPPKPKLLMFVYHVPAKPPLAVLKLAGDVVQVDPLYSSVAPVTWNSSKPPKAKAAVCIPAPAKRVLLYLNFH
jgi:hypothetical protein